MRPSCTCTRRFHLLDLNSGYGLDWKISLVPADAWRNVEVWLDAVALLARRRSRQPGCFASGESLGKSEGESKLSPADYSLAFPGCEASGLAASPPGQKHNDAKSDFRVPPSISGNQADLLIQAVSATEVQEMKSPGAGARGPHRPSLRLCFLPFYIWQLYQTCLSIRAARMEIFLSTGV